MSTTAANTTTAKAKLGIAVIAIALTGWLTFVLGAWNHNLLLTIVAFLVPGALRSIQNKKLFNAKTDLEYLVFGILLWNHMVAVIIILFILKVLVMKLRK